MLAWRADSVTSLSIIRQNPLWFPFHKHSVFHKSQEAQGTIRTSNKGWSLKIVKAKKGSYPLGFFSPLHNTPSVSAVAALVGVTFLLHGATCGTGIMEAQEWICDSALSCFRKESEGKVRPESSPRKSLFSRLIRIMPYTYILLSRS